MSELDIELSAQSLTTKLLVRRASSEENALCALTREMSEEQKLIVVEKLRV